MICLYILEIKTLPCVCKYFLLFHTFYFHILKVFFAMQKLVHLIRSHLFILFLFIFLWEMYIRKHWYDFCQRMFWLCSLPELLWCHVLCLSIKAILSLFLCMVRGCVLNFIDLHAAVQFSQLHLLKRIFCHFMFFFSFVKD